MEDNKAKAKLLAALKEQAEAAGKIKSTKPANKKLEKKEPEFKIQVSFQENRRMRKNQKDH